MGLQWIEGQNKGKVGMANALVLFALQALEAVALARRSGLWFHALLEFPEHLGKAAFGNPATIWALPQVQAILSVQAGFFTMAFFHCDFGAETAKPTRLVTTLAPLLRRGFGGNFRLDGEGRYVGPLPRHCGRAHQKHIGSDAAKQHLSHMAV